MGCCSDDSASTQNRSSDEEAGEKEENKTNGQEIPKSFIGRFLYNAGKKDFEKNKGKAKGGGCC